MAWRGVARHRPPGSRAGAEGPVGAGSPGIQTKEHEESKGWQNWPNSLLGRSKLPLAIVSQSVPAATRTKRSCSHFASRATTIWTILQKPRCARRTHPQSQHVFFVPEQRTYIFWGQKQIEARRVFKPFAIGVCSHVYGSNSGAPLPVQNCTKDCPGALLPCVCRTLRRPPS